MGADVFNSSYQKVEVGRSLLVTSQPDLQSKCQSRLYSNTEETLSQKSKKEKKRK